MRSPPRRNVSVQTLRHYHKLGLLEPSTVSDAGYRRYSEIECARLKLIRTLRGVGFDLKTVARLLEGRSNARDVLRLQVAVLGSEIEVLKRQQVVLNAVARSEVGEADLLAMLARLKVLAQLDKLEREAFLARHLGGARGKTPQSEEIWRAAVLDLPQTMIEQQLEVWLELAELAADEGFQALLARQGEPFEALDAESTLEWHRLLGQVTARATEAVKTGLSAQSETARAILNDWTGGLARILGREEDRAFQQWMLETLQPDPRPPYSAVLATGRRTQRPALFARTCWGVWLAARGLAGRTWGSSFPT